MKTAAPSLPQQIVRATRRPDNVSPPAHWTNSPVPSPKEGASSSSETSDQGPTRYGDWVSKGIAVDF